jgi:hypothetical protein
MKNFILLTILFFALPTIGQEQDELSLLESDATWIKEIIEFPIGFAQEIKYEGFEDLRFPQGWSKEDSPNFWSYTWAWSLNDVKELTESELEINIQYYFDGLLGHDFYKIDGIKTPKTTAVFIKKEASNGVSKYIGKVKTVDTRYTKKPMTLHVLVEQYYCDEQNKAIIFFKFSPKEFENDVWNTLNEVKLQDNFCNI